MTPPDSNTVPAPRPQTVPVAGVRVREAANRLADSVSGPAGAVVLDLAAVEFVGSEDLGALVALHRRLKGAGGRLALVNVRPAVSDVLTVTRLDTLFDVARGPGK